MLLGKPALLLPAAAGRVVDPDQREPLVLLGGCQIELRGQIGPAVGQNLPCQGGQLSREKILQMSGMIDEAARKIEEC